MNSGLSSGGSGGMQLGKSKTPSALSQFMKEENVQLEPESKSKTSTSSQSSSKQQQQPSKPQHKYVSYLLIS
jgi:hypothetical protein